jgi:hypothetical protein
MGTRIWGAPSHKGAHQWQLDKLYGGVCRTCKKKTGKDYYRKLRFKCGVPGCLMFEVRKHKHV